MTTKYVVSAFVFLGLALTLSHGTQAIAEEKPFESILFVGDSHSTGNFGKTVDTYLRTLSPKVTSVASCGSSPSNWMGVNKTYSPTNCGYWRKESNGKEISVKSHAIDPFLDEVKKAKPDLTVIALGTNILASPQNIDKEILVMEKMVKEVKRAGSRCVLIGPPDAKKLPFAALVVDGTSKMKHLADAYDCKFINSSVMTKYEGKGDGIHYGAKEATEWGQKVVQEMRAQIVTVKTTPSVQPNSETKTAPADAVR